MMGRENSCVFDGLGDRAYQWVIIKRKRMLGTIWLSPISRDYGAGF